MSETQFFEIGAKSAAGADLTSHWFNIRARSRVRTAFAGALDGNSAVLFDLNGIIANWIFLLKYKLGAW